MKVIPPPTTLEVTTCDTCWFANHEYSYCQLIWRAPWCDRETGEANINYADYPEATPVPQHCPLRTGPVVIKLKK